MKTTKVVGWGPFPLPGEKKRLERAEKEARKMLGYAKDAEARKTKND